MKKKKDLIILKITMLKKIIRLIGIGDKRKKDNFKLGVITLDLSMFKDKDEKEIYKKLFDKLEKERLT